MTNTEEIKDKMTELNPDAILYDDLDNALVGLGRQYPNNHVFIYDMDKIVKVFEEMGMTHLEALEHYDFNVGGMGMGENTPLIIDFTGDTNDD